MNYFRFILSDGKMKILFLLLCGFGWQTGLTQTPAFPGAEGFGRFTSGGRGGQVLEVTNLNDGGAGSLRAAVESSGPRTVIFRVSGTIELRSPLLIRNDHITIAGQTAAGDGICIRDYSVLVEANEVIIRYLRFRLGDRYKQAADAICGIGQSAIIIDHCSMSWGIDEVASFYDNRNFTMQWCLVSESLNNSYHPKGNHGYGGIWGGKGATFHHNLLAHHASRNPRFNGSRTNWGVSGPEIVDHRNNVVYNWSENSAYGGEGGNQNMISNYYKYGPATKSKSLRKRIVNPWGIEGRWYVAGNYVWGFPEITADNWAGGVASDFPHTIRLDQPVPCAEVITHEAGTAYLLVLADAGAVIPRRDAVDRRIVEEVRTGTAAYGSLPHPGAGIIGSQSEVGGWPELKTYDVPNDTDHDGMADDWELTVGLNPAVEYDNNQDRNGDGYTNLEEYLNGLCIRNDYLPAPAELEVNHLSEKECELKWKGNASGAAGFLIECSAGDTLNFKEISRVYPDTYTYKVSGLDPAGNYFYRIRAFKTNLFSLHSNMAKVVSAVKRVK
jgi:hypothetical protein